MAPVLLQCAVGYSLVAAWGSTLVVMRFTFYLWWVSSSLVVICRLFSSCGRGAPLQLQQNSLLNCDGDDSSLLVMRRDIFLVVMCRSLHSACGSGSPF